MSLRARAEITACGSQERSIRVGWIGFGAASTLAFAATFGCGEAEVTKLTAPPTNSGPHADAGPQADAGEADACTEELLDCCASDCGRCQTLAAACFMMTAGDACDGAVGRATYVGMIEGAGVITTENVTCEGALANCVLNAANNPNIQCRWGDRRLR